AIDVQEMQVAQADLTRSNVLALAVPESAAAEESERRPGSEQTLAAHIAWVVRRHADSFMGIQETHQLLSRAASQLPELAAEVQKSLPLQKIAEVLRRLVQEGISIRYLREICESLVVWGAREKDIVMLTEYVRVDLGRFIVPRYLDAKGHLRAVVLDGSAEKILEDAIQQGPGGGFLALAPEAAQALMAGAEQALSPLKSEGPQVVLTSMGVRRYLK